MSAIPVPAAANAAARDDAAPLRRLWRGRPEDPAWVRPALVGLLVLTALLYVVNLGAAGWGNAYYSAAVQAATESWKAFLFGSSDAANSITVDKTPASLWVMALSARLFGLNTWSLLVPQALMGAATAGLLYASVRRLPFGGPGGDAPAGLGPAAGLLAAAAFALTPVTALMFRYNNPDALLVLLMVLAAWAVLRAVEDGRGRWLVLAGACVGFGFLTKMLQAFLVLPALAVVFLLCGPGGLLRRTGQLLLGGLALLVSAGWWVALVELWPENSRPYIGGSQENSVLELTFGYNGLGRLNGEEPGSVGGGGSGGGGGGGGDGGGMIVVGPGGEITSSGGWGATGIGRLFDASSGGQAAWLLPAALLLLTAGLWLTLRAPRTSPLRAGFVLWGGWLLTHWLVFSYMRGIYHEYYTVALVPGVAAVVAMGCAVLWRRRAHPAAALTLAAATALTAWWAFVLLNRSPDWAPWLRYAVAAAGAAAVLGLLLPLLPRVAGARWAGRLAAGTAGAALLAGLAGPAAFAAEAVANPDQGSIPVAGPPAAGALGGPGLMERLGPGAAPGGPGGPRPGGKDGGAPGGAPTPGGGPAMYGGNQRVGGGAGGGLLDASRPSEELAALLEEDADAYTWVAASVGSQVASGYQLATREPVMPIGGFNGTDPSPTFERFRELVRAGEIHWFVDSGGGPGSLVAVPVGGGAEAATPVLMGPSAGDPDSPGERISSWVRETFTPVTVDGITLYDLTNPLS
ncbi:glycosyltransferase family 39 protein [Streptomyces sp. DSM 44917]|uniref:Glycosyltransferase family 39 protein n=1 Tax=Streptomyces boetiae TaxID=3075541 RepID=A0ABU2LC17_9ACTN|nr:glycosyltransferase family 39 protein [Streptomyces sp. DSM 44917]MDT0309057.1 glycosyltransferase family 39 protein [Streptomyces sp. DSM 44917]